jgi:transcriptional regulator with XRE-family HTH domain
MQQNRETRKSALTRLGVSQRTIAKRLDVDVSLVCLIMAGKRKGIGFEGRRVSEYIALLIGKPVTEVFPCHGVDHRRKAKDAAA